MNEFSNKFRHTVQRAHKNSLSGAETLMGILAENDVEYMTTVFGSLQQAAEQLETAARQVRDIIVITRTELEQSQEPRGPNGERNA